MYGLLFLGNVYSPIFSVLPFFLVARSLTAFQRCVMSDYWLERIPVTELQFNHHFIFQCFTWFYIIIYVQFCRHLILSEEGHIDWKLMYFALQKYYPIKEQYGDTLHFCRHCSILFWKVRALKEKIRNKFKQLLLIVWKEKY